MNFNDDWVIGRLPLEVIDTLTNTYAAFYVYSFDAYKHVHVYYNSRSSIKFERTYLNANIDSR